MLVVQKFGGSSVANAERVFNVAGRIAETYDKGNEVVVILSAQGDTTDDLIEKAHEINPNPSKREMDMLLSTGEQQSVALMAMALEKMGYNAVSLNAFQVGIATTSVYSNAKMTRRRRHPLMTTDVPAQIVAAHLSYIVTPVRAALHPNCFIRHLSQ